MYRQKADETVEFARSSKLSSTSSPTTSKDKMDSPMNTERKTMNAKEDFIVLSTCVLFACVQIKVGPIYGETKVRSRDILKRRSVNKRLLGKCFHFVVDNKVDDFVHCTCGAYKVNYKKNRELCNYMTDRFLKQHEPKVSDTQGFWYNTICF